MMTAPKWLCVTATIVVAGVLLWPTGLHAADDEFAPIRAAAAGLHADQPQAWRLTVAEAGEGAVSVNLLIVTYPDGTVVATTEMAEQSVRVVSSATELFMINETAGVYSRSAPSADVAQRVATLMPWRLDDAILPIVGALWTAEPATAYDAMGLTLRASAGANRRTYRSAVADGRKFKITIPGADERAWEIDLYGEQKTAIRLVPKALADGQLDGLRDVLPPAGARWTDEPGAVYLSFDPHEKAYEAALLARWRALDRNPLTPTVTVMTNQDMRNWKADLLTRYMVEAYAKVGARDPKWDDQAVAFLTATTEAVRDGSGRERWLELFDEGREIIALGCGDHAVHCMTAFAHRASESGMRYPMTAAFQSAVKSAYDPVVRLVWWEQSDGFGVGSNQPPEGKLLAEGILAMPDLSAPDRQVLASVANVVIMGIDDPELLRPAEDATKSLPTSMKAETEMFLGLCHMRRAWIAREGDDDTTAEDWRVYHEHSPQAYAHLEASWQAGVRYRALPRMMLSAVRMAGGDEQLYRVWFERGMAIQADDAAMLHNYFFGYWPRWMGHESLMLELGREFAETRAYTTNVPLIYLDWALVDVVYRDHQMPGLPYLMTRPQEYTTIREVLTGSRDAENTSNTRGQWNSLLAGHAWQFQDYAQCREDLAAAGDEMRGNYFEHKLSASVQMIRRDAAVFGGVHGAELRRLAELWDCGQHATVARLADALLAATDLEEAEREWLTARATLCAMQARFAAGDWVDLTADGNFDLWATYFGNWTHEPGRVTAVDADRDSAGLTTLLHVGLDWELTATFAASDGGNNPTIAIYDDRETHHRYAVLAIRFRNDAIVTSVSYDPVYGDTFDSYQSVASPALEGPLHLRIQNVAGKANVYVNDILVASRLETPVFTDPSLSNVTLYGHDVDAETRRITWSDVRIRRLESLPTPSVDAERQNEINNLVKTLPDRLKSVTVHPKKFFDTMDAIGPNPTLTDEQQAIYDGALRLVQARDQVMSGTRQDWLATDASFAPWFIGNTNYQREIKSATWADKTLTLACGESGPGIFLPVCPEFFEWQLSVAKIEADHTKPMSFSFGTAPDGLGGIQNASFNTTFKIEDKPVWGSAGPIGKGKSVKGIPRPIAFQLRLVRTAAGDEVWVNGTKAYSGPLTEGDSQLFVTLPNNGTITISEFAIQRLNADGTPYTPDTAADEPPAADEPGDGE